MFFGREAELKIRVVLKQYHGNKKRAILAEIKIFTLLEKLKKNQAGCDLIKVLDQSN